MSELTRAEAAEEVCWTILLAMEFGILPPPEDKECREFVAGPMAAWAKLACPADDIDDDGGG